MRKGNKTKKKVKILTVVGARPQFVKAVTVSRAMKDKFKEVIVHTGQHYDAEMSDGFFKDLNIPKPKYNLKVGSRAPSKQIAFMLEGIEDVLLKEKPGVVLVYGDTNSTLAGALAASKQKIPVVHIEAGLRSFNRNMPEEVNRLVVDHIANLLFCPTKTAVCNLKLEGIRKNVFLVGDVMYDSLLYHLPVAERKSKVLLQLKVEPQSYCLLTIHRAENTTDLERLKEMLHALDDFKMPVIFPVHPRTRKFFNNTVRPKRNLLLIPPLPYLDMLTLEKNARAIFTDSGGMQKEAYIMEVPCVTLRQETEWTETIKKGANEILTKRRRDISLVCNRAIRRKVKFEEGTYGLGDAAERIVDILKQHILEV